jgi:hypothetical protein
MNTIRHALWCACSAVERSSDHVAADVDFTARVRVANAPTDSVMKNGCGEAVIRISMTSTTSLAFLMQRSCSTEGGEASTYSVAVRTCPRNRVNSILKTAFRASTNVRWHPPT